MWQWTVMGIGIYVEVQNMTTENFSSHVCEKHFLNCYHSTGPSALPNCSSHLVTHQAVFTLIFIKENFLRRTATFDDCDLAKIFQRRIQELQSVRH